MQILPGLEIECCQLPDPSVNSLLLYSTTLLLFHSQRKQCGFVCLYNHALSFLIFLSLSFVYVSSFQIFCVLIFLFSCYAIFHSMNMLQFIRFPWRREWQPTPVFLPGEFHGQRSWWAAYSPRGCKEQDITEELTHTHTLQFINTFKVLMFPIQGYSGQHSCEHFLL